MQHNLTAARNHLDTIEAGYSTEKQALANARWPPNEDNVSFVYGQVDIRQYYFIAQITF